MTPHMILMVALSFTSLHFVRMAARKLSINISGLCPRSFPRFALHRDVEIRDVVHDDTSQV
eukprot:CAMPEP_0184484382 /NCGR_PEP_ID=MMETSP0113_2-20130426/6112_1 /TAXON_ID=91329 /ORGANISM="Norrisiella sphaerica, Strain BC52" /LENGTH=60 /DNA_ID=CAMNT_0026865365 /DNA_START=31 /DNA_END=213 /DNA_ORIENTATION=-